MAESVSDESFFTAIRQGEFEVVKAIIETRGPSILTQMTHRQTVIWPNLLHVSQEVANCLPVKLAAPNAVHTRCPRRIDS